MVEEILTAARRLSVHEKLVVARKLLDEAIEESLLPHFEPGTIIELYSPIEVEGITDELSPNRFGFSNIGQIRKSKIKNLQS